MEGSYGTALPSSIGVFLKTLAAPISTGIVLTDLLKIYALTYVMRLRNVLSEARTDRECTLIRQSSRG